MARRSVGFRVCAAGSGRGGIFMQYQATPPDERGAVSAGGAGGAGGVGSGGERGGLVRRELVVDGVRVLHFPADGEVTDATLIFGVGQRDETLATQGSVHALEHVVMDAVRRTPIEINASVDASVTVFTANGSPARVAEFLSGVCSALAEPPVDRLAAEAKVLAAEGAGGGGTPLAVARFGCRDLGLLATPGPGPSAVSAAKVQEVAGRWFVGGNALLLVDGPLPDGLRLPLPDRPRPGHDRVVPRRWSEPHAVCIDVPAAAVSLILPPSDGTATELVARVLISERVTEVLRHERGLTYEVNDELNALGDGWELVVETLPPPEQAVEAGRALIDTIRRLLTAGPTEAELEHAYSLVRESGRGRDGEMATIADVEIGVLLGDPVTAFSTGEVPTLEREVVADYLRGIAADVLFLVDERLEPELPGLGVPVAQIGPTRTGPLPAGQVFKPPLLARAISRDARTARVVLTDDGLAQQLGDQVSQVDWAGVAGVLRDPDGDLTVFGLDGTAISVGPGLYGGGRRLVDAILNHIPSDVIYDDPEPVQHDDAAVR